MIYDCFPFNGESKLLEIRLHHHVQFVDKFVISESKYTYSGKPKPLFFNEIKDEYPFVKFNDKIIYRVFDNPPKQGESNWDYEYRQRNHLLGILPLLTTSDLILYLDCDEMIRDKSVIEAAFGNPLISMLDMKLCWYYFNCIIKPGSAYQNDYSMESCFKGRWCMGKIVNKNQLFSFANNLYRIREYGLWNRSSVNVIENAGWHFSNLGEPKRIYNKMKAFSHSDEFEEKYNISEELIQERKSKLVDPLGRPVEFMATELDVPEYVLKNIDKYREEILDVPNN